VVRHAGASEVEIRIELDRRQVRLTVHDNGRGFDPRQEFTGRGLDSLRSRTGAIGGKIEIQSAPGVGTTVCLEADITRSDD
jgi:signal transduction histidine kinase